MLPTSSTFPVVRSFQQKWMRESSVCWMYTWPLRLSGVTVLPFMVILPARNSTRYLLEELRDPDTMLGNRAPDAIVKNCCKTRQNQTGNTDKYQGRIPEMLTITVQKLSPIHIWPYHVVQQSPTKASLLQTRLYLHPPDSIQRIKMYITIKERWCHRRVFRKSSLVITSTV